MDRPPKKKKKALVERWPFRERWPLVRRFDSIIWYYLNFFWNLVSLRLQQIVLSNTVILTEINEATGYLVLKAIVFAATDKPFRKLRHSRKLYLCMDSASRIFFSFLSVYEVVRIAKTKKQFAWLACWHNTPTSNIKWVIKKSMRTSVRTQTTY